MNIRFVSKMLNIRTFYCYLIRYFVAISTNITRIFSCMSSTIKSVPGDLLLSDLTMKKTTTAKLLLTYLICTLYIMYTHPLGYKIKSLTLLKRINFTKQTRVKLTGNTVSLPSVSAMCRSGFRVCLGLVEVNLGLVRVT